MPLGSVLEVTPSKISKSTHIGTLFRYANMAYPKDTDITYKGVIE